MPAGGNLQNSIDEIQLFFGPPFLFLCSRGTSANSSRNKTLEDSLVKRMGGMGDGGSIGEKIQPLAGLPTSKQAKRNIRATPGAFFTSQHRELCFSVNGR